MTELPKTIEELIEKKDEFRYALRVRDVRKFSSQTFIFPQQDFLAINEIFNDFMNDKHYFARFNGLDATYSSPSAEDINTLKIAAAFLHYELFNMKYF